MIQGVEIYIIKNYKIKLWDSFHGRYQSQTNKYR